MIKFDYKIEKFEEKIFEIQPGIYYSEWRNDDEVFIYRKITVTDKSIKYITLKNDESAGKSLSFTDDGDYPHWSIERCFIGGKNYRWMSEEEFNKQLTEVLSFFESLV